MRSRSSDRRRLHAVRIRRRERLSRERRRWDRLCEHPFRRCTAALRNPSLRTRGFQCQRSEDRLPGKDQSRASLIFLRKRQLSVLSRQSRANLLVLHPVFQSLRFDSSAGFFASGRFLLLSFSGLPGFRGGCLSLSLPIAWAVR